MYVLFEVLLLKIDSQVYRRNINKHEIYFTINKKKYKKDITEHFKLTCENPVLV